MTNIPDETLAKMRAALEDAKYFSDKGETVACSRRINQVIASLDAAVQSCVGEDAHD